MLGRSCCLCLAAVLAGALTSYSQGRCPEWEELISTDTEFQFPLFDRFSNTTFSRLYVASFGDSANLVDWKLQRSIGEHLLIAGEPRKALTLLRAINRHHPDDYETSGLLADAYQLLGIRDSALMVITPAASAGDFTNYYGSRYVQAQILRAAIAGNYSGDWIFDNSVLALDTLLVEVDRIGHSDVILRNIMGFARELHRQVELTPTPDLTLARSFEEVADIMAMHLSRRGASILYHVALQYDPGNALGIKAKFESNNERIVSCGWPVFSDEELASTFPSLREVTTVDTEYVDEMKRVLAYQTALEQQQALSRTKKKWAIAAILVIAFTGIGYAWRRITADQTSS